MPGRSETDMTRRKPKPFDEKKEVRAIARERVGTPPPSRVIAPKHLRKKPKHKRAPGESDHDAAG
jgi:hypothetical protein